MSEQNASQGAMTIYAPPAVVTVVAGGRQRNLPCPCGSGKRVKHCCGTRQVEVRPPSHRPLVVGAILAAMTELQEDRGER